MLKELLHKPGELRCGAASGLGAALLEELQCGAASGVPAVTVTLL